MEIFKETLISELIEEFKIDEGCLQTALEEYGADDFENPTIDECIYTIHDMVLDGFKMAVIEYQDKIGVETFTCISRIDIEIKAELYNFGFRSGFHDFDFLDRSDKNVSLFIEEYLEKIGTPEKD